MRNMNNPFRYGGIVGPEAFCNREREMAELKRSLANAEHLFLYAERRMGKTSLIRRVLSTLSTRTYLPVYIDLWPTDGTTMFVTAMAKALTEAAATRTEKLLETSRRFFQHLSPSLTLDDSGTPALNFGMTRVEAKGPQLEEVLNAPLRIAEERGRKVVIVFDEFQRLLEYDDDRVERTLRSKVQTHTGVGYLFLGSRKHLIQQMFLDQNRPLYRSAGHYPLGPIGTDHWKPFVRERFELAKKHISDTLIESLCAMTEGHPFYTQHVAHALWELTEREEEVTEEKLRNALDLLLQRESYAYTLLWESLTKNHQRFLRGLATEKSGASPFSSEFVHRHGVRTASNAQRAAESLISRDIIDRDNGTFIITDRFFRLWIERMG
jgi:AAA+ ATPase superfamily predicted ATPase